jgi:hypothetical protein
MRTIAFLLICTASCFAQLDDNTVTVTATRDVVLQPDQAVVTVNLSTAADAGLDDALTILDGTGFNASDLVSANTYQYYDGTLTNWQFSKALPFSGLKALLPRIATIQQSHGQNDSIAYVFDYYVSSQPSQAAQQAASVCPIPTLVADARAQAQQIATAAGARIGSVVSMSQGDASSMPSVGLPAYGPMQGVILGVPPQAEFSNLLVSSRPASLPPGCSLMVRFQLLR